MAEATMKMTPEVAAEHGLSAEEYARIPEILGREPNFTELGIFSVMWSEHCSYKSSRAHLRGLPSAGPQVVQGPGENAGVVEIGEGLVAAFKIESHNHPSFVEPFQGAATGVGGILRDIFTMGARPIAVLDSLRFGPISDAGLGARNARGSRPAESEAAAGAGGVTAEEKARNRRIVDGVVSGIAFYGNCFGVATVGGEVQFEPCYSGNPLVNVLALGIARREELFFARASGAGNPVIYVGAKTGRDGIHGASLLASAGFGEESREKRPNVQVGDPFMEKLLLEACLEAMHGGGVVAIQDMGAAGLTSSSAEMASRGGAGIEIDLDRVPQRETGMTPYEMMLSESQERMLLVAQRGREQEVMQVFGKWGLDAVVIGRVTAEGLLRVVHQGKVAAEIPADALAKQAPIYERPAKAPGQSRGEGRVLMEFVKDGADLTENFLRLLGSPAIASKRWIFEQYDTMVRTNTRLGPEAADAAVLRLKGSARGLAVSVDGNGRWCWLDPRVGAMHAVAEAARNVACTGAKPIGATNCLNFGNPEKPEVMWEFTEAVKGIAEACRALGIPITGGNVSFYNETLDRPIYPTPVIGVVGMLEDVAQALGTGFGAAGDVIVLLEAKAGEDAAGSQSSLKEAQREFSSSEYAKAVGGIVSGRPPGIALEGERKLSELLVRLASEGLLRSAHDISDGGLAVALAESSLAGLRKSAELGGAGELGAEVAFEGRAPAELALFGEGGGRVVVSVRRDWLARLQALAAKYKIQAVELGTVSSGEIRIQYNGAVRIAVDAGTLRQAWASSFERAVRGT